MAKPVGKECCPKCNSTIFVKATDKSNKHYCHGKGCGHVWIPGVEVSSRPDFMIQKLQKDNFELQDQINKLRKENESLRAQIPASTASAAEIFT